MRMTKAALIHRRTKNLRAVQLLFRHAKALTMAPYVGIDVDDALDISGQMECPGEHGWLSLLRNETEICTSSTTQPQAQQQATAGKECGAAWLGHGCHQ